jgi:hypothetical protein
MTLQNAMGVKVTIYQDDIVVRGPSYAYGI